MRTVGALALCFLVMAVAMLTYSGRLTLTDGCQTVELDGRCLLSSAVPASEG